MSDGHRRREVGDGLGHTGTHSDGGEELTEILLREGYLLVYRRRVSLDVETGRLRLGKAPTVTSA